MLVGGSQGLAPLLHVRSGTVYPILIESRWAPNDSSLLRQAERLIPAARQSCADLDVQRGTQMVPNWERSDDRCFILFKLDISVGVQVQLRME